MHVSYAGMADTPEAGEKLLARAAAAIEEAKRLSSRNEAIRIDLQEQLRRIRTRTVFHPSSQKVYSPSDFLGGGPYSISPQR